MFPKTQLQRLCTWLAVFEMLAVHGAEENYQLIIKLLVVIICL